MNKIYLLPRIIMIVDIKLNRIKIPRIPCFIYLLLFCDRNDKMFLTICGPNINS